MVLQHSDTVIRQAGTLIANECSITTRQHQRLPGWFSSFTVFIAIISLWVSDRYTHLYHALLSNIHIFIISLFFSHTHTYSGLQWKHMDQWSLALNVSVVFWLDRFKTHEPHRITTSQPVALNEHCKGILPTSQSSCHGVHGSTGGILVEKGGPTLVL